jgi:hypothetical protein
MLRTEVNEGNEGAEAASSRGLVLWHCLIVGSTKRGFSGF